MPKLPHQKRVKVGVMVVVIDAFGALEKADYGVGHRQQYDFDNHLETPTHQQATYPCEARCLTKCICTHIIHT
jgi:hypothetical protein